MFIENIDIMIYYNNNKIVKTYQNGSLINKIDKVVSGGTPTPIETIKYKSTGGTYSKEFECDSTSAVTTADTLGTTNVMQKTRIILNTTDIYIGRCVTTIGYGAFDSFSKITSVTIPNSVTHIGDFAFRNCSGLSKFICLPSTPPVLALNVFSNTNCSFYVPSESLDAYKAADVWSNYANRIYPTAITPSVTSESKTIFQYVTNGNEPTPPTPVGNKLVATYTGGTTYTLACDSSSTLSSGETRPRGYDYVNMTDAVIGDCVTVIGMDAFSGTSLSSVTIPSSVTTIYSEAFERCYSLSSVTIPDSVTNIGPYSFNYCRSLTGITIPDSVTDIDSYAFNGCSAMTSVEIGSGITTIELQAFNYCSGLTGITINATTPPTLVAANAFSNTNNCPIYVPCESVDAYKAATNWSSLASRIQAIPGSCSSRLPSGYTEVEYITSENVSESVLGPYIDTNYKPTQNTRVVIDYQSTSSTRNYQRIFGSGEYNLLGYLVNIEGEIGTSGYYYYKFGQSSNWYTTSVQTDLNRHIIDYNNSNQFLIDNTSIATLPNTTFTCTSNLGIFWSINTKYTTFNINFIGRIFSAKVYDDGTLIRDLVPCTNPNNVAGMYDIVNDAFYSSANSYNFTAGNPV